MLLGPLLLSLAPPHAARVAPARAAPCVMLHNPADDSLLLSTSISLAALAPFLFVSIMRLQEQRIWHSAMAGSSLLPSRPPSQQDDDIWGKIATACSTTAPAFTNVEEATTGAAKDLRQLLDYGVEASAMRGVVVPTCIGETDTVAAAVTVFARALAMRESLQTRLEEAVAREDYSEAAELKRELEGAAGVAGDATQS